MMKNPDHPLFEEPHAAGAGRPAHLVWRDEESGERLSIELISSPEFLEDLIGQGFAVELDRPSVPSFPTCRIVTRSDDD